MILPISVWWRCCRGVLGIRVGAINFHVWCFGARFISCDAAREAAKEKLIDLYQVWLWKRGPKWPKGLR